MRRVTLANERVFEVLSKACVLYTHDTRRLPTHNERRTVRMLVPPDGEYRRLTFAGEGGENFWCCFCDSDGTIVHFFTGFRSPDEFLQELDFAHKRWNGLRQTQTAHTKPTRSRVVSGTPVNVLDQPVKPFLDGVLAFPRSKDEPNSDILK